MPALQPRIPLLILAVATQLQAEDKLTFNHDIRPILSDKCFFCHGFDPKHREGDVRLDVPEGAYKADKDGVTPIKPGSLKDSEVWNRINTTDEDDVMPPTKSHKILSKAEKDIIQKWIEQGAPYQKHWAFEAPVKTPPPAVPAGMKARNEIDNFLLARLEKEKLKPQPEADKETLIRRVTFALTGLPPTIAEVDAFLADNAPDAYEKLVDRLLNSPRYGEQMARYWLDVARYGDTHGLHLDNERQMYAYRDWVVSAFNQNEHFDQFTVEQLAGDLLPNPTTEQMVATGFNRCNVTTSEGGAIAAEFLFRYAVDRASTTAQTWMGLTAGCAVCHDHKFDPISQKEFYQLYSFFYSAADPGMDGNALLTAPVIKVNSPESTKRLEELKAKVQTAEKQLEETVAKLDYKDPASIVPPPPAKEQVTMLIDEQFPTGANMHVDPPGNAMNWTSEKSAASGKLALKVSGSKMAQTYYSGGAPVIDVPAGAVFKVNVFIDPADVPKAVMIQFNTSDWKHRAMWGDPNAIPGFGTPNTTQRFVAGPLPEGSKWIELEVPAEKMGLNAGDKINGIAFTQDGGTAYFDNLRIVARTNDAADPTKSLVAWMNSGADKDIPGVPGNINKLLRMPAGKRNAAEQKELRDYYLGRVCATTKPTLAPLEDAIARATKERDEFDKSIPSTFVMKDLPTPRQANIMERGAYDKPGEKVYPGTPAAFPPLPNPKNPNRLDLAKWLVADNHPLTARVTVNRFWQQFFGIGLVKTAGDFGSQGQPPSNQELLDYLAVTFRESGWDVKKLVRSFVTTAAFRQSSSAPASLWESDPQNRLLARGPRFRLDAEELRDNALAVSGLLDLTMGGRGTRPYQPANIWEPLGYIDSNTRNYKRDTGKSLYRRSIYTFLKRTAPPPFMGNFDAPSREQTCQLRERSDTPMQALQLMNDEQHVEAARVFAEQIISKGGATPDERIVYAYRTVISRRPTNDELEVVKEALKEHLTAFNQTPDFAAKFIRVGESLPKAGLQEPELAAWTLVANLILNLDETITRN